MGAIMNKQIKNFIPLLAQSMTQMSCYGLIGLAVILSGCASSSKKVSRLSFEAMPKLTVDSELRLGGHSGLYYLGDDLFITHTDRGPNLELVDSKRPFVHPNYTPELIKFKLADGVVTVLERIQLKDPNGKPLSGLPNIASDEIPTDTKGKLLKRDLGGGDFEGITRDAFGNWWLCDEYRPAIWKFNSVGQLITRFVPEGSYTTRELQVIEARWGKGSVVQNLPKVLSQRRLNRGFEGLTIAGNTLYAILQSPIKKGELDIPILEFDLTTNSSLGVSYYKLKSSKAEKMGDLTFANGAFYAIEQNGKLGSKSILAIVQLEKQGNEWQAIKRWSLSAMGINDTEKMEGLALVDGKFVLVNDNDFGVHADAKSQVFVIGEL